MSYCRKEGKDQILFVTKEDFGIENNKGSGNPLLPGDESEAVGLIKENGEINWDCPCLQGMGKGPCGDEFKDAFACFHYSESEPKGSNCIQQFQSMQKCFQKHPDVYGSLDDDDDDDDEGDKLQQQNDTEINNEIESASKLEVVNTNSSGTGQVNLSEQLEKDSGTADDKVSI